MTEKIEATATWVQQTLGSDFLPFSQRWRDSSQAEFTPLVIHGHALGHLIPALKIKVVEAFEALDIAYQEGSHWLELTSSGQDAQAALTRTGEWLRQNGLVPFWRDELFTLLDNRGEALFELERGLFKTFGFQSQAVHMHATTGNNHGWISRRSMQKTENPGMLDNLSAGGLSAGESPMACCKRELWEEAGIDEKAIVALHQVETLIWVNRPLNLGWHNELIHTFRVTLSEKAKPCNQDGEAMGFYLMPPMPLQNMINRWQFTPDAGLVTALQLSGH